MGVYTYRACGMPYDQWNVTNTYYLCNFNSNVYCSMFTAPEDSVGNVVDSFFSNLMLSCSQCCHRYTHKMVLFSLSVFLFFPIARHIFLRSNFNASDLNCLDAHFSQSLHLFDISFCHIYVIFCYNHFWVTIFVSNKRQNHRIHISVIMWVVCRFRYVEHSSRRKKNVVACLQRGTPENSQFKEHNTISSFL